MELKGPSNICRWERASVTLTRPITEEYRIRFKAVFIMNDVEFAFDDFSMSPACFIGGESVMCCRKRERNV